MDDRYVFKNGKRLRTGYTTGSCAAAAAKAAAWMLIHQRPLRQISIDTPKGWELMLDVMEGRFDAAEAECCIIKDAGDDPDITDGIEVWAKVRWDQGSEIAIKGGTGIGVVTRKGLAVPVGSPAINPVPRKMILEEVTRIIGRDRGVEVTICMPKGVELAKKTFNPQLGIEGGLSVLGTTGIVEPMSEEALKDTIAIELGIHRAEGRREMVLVPGNYGEAFGEKTLGISGEYMIKISNYLGFVLEKCAELGFRKLLLCGHIGKLIKPAGGIYYTHSRVSSTRMEILTAHLGVLGMKREDLQKIMDCRTTEEAIPIIDQQGYEAVYPILAEKCAQNCERYIYNALDIGVVLFSMERMLAMSQKAPEMVQKFQERKERKGNL